ncbi:MAG: hypothetical protein ABI810_05360 [Sphingomonas bacterium]
MQFTLDDRDRIKSISAISRRFDNDCSDWRGSTYLTFERTVTRNLALSTGAFAHGDRLNAGASSNKEFGVIAGIDGELRAASTSASALASHP